MKKDLKNRSVYYSDGGSVDSSRTHDLIIRDSDPLNVGNEGITTINNITNYRTNDDPSLLNNVRITLDSQRYQNNATEIETNEHIAAISNLAVKNVNVDNVKLEAHASCDALETDGAAGTSYQNINLESNNFDVNVFHNDFKSNINSRYQNKAVKADLEVMIRNNLTGNKNGNPKRQKNKDDSDDDDDSISKLKVNLSTSKNGSCD